MRDDVYDYDMINAYKVFEGTKQGNRILAAARYMAGEMARQAVTREDLFMHASGALSSVLEEMRKNDQLLSLAEGSGPFHVSPVLACCSAAEP